VDARGEADRREARALAATVATRAPALLRAGGVDLTSSFEQSLYMMLRTWEREDRDRIRLRPAPIARIVPFARLARASPRIPFDRRSEAPGGALILISAAVHARLLAPVAAQAMQSFGMPLHVLAAASAGIVAKDAGASAFGSVRQLEDILDLGWLPRLGVHAVRSAAMADWATAPWTGIDAPRAEILGRLAREAIPRLALMAARLDGAVRRLRPAVLATYDETGIWSRLLPAVAHANHLPAVDLPHGEAADPWGTMGAAYDMMAVYGPRAASVLRAANIPAERIAQVGAPAFDELVRDFATAYRPWTLERRVILLASQPAVSWARYHTTEAKALVLQAAIAIGSDVQPARLVVRPHPTEDRAAIAREVEALALPAGLEVVIDDGMALGELLRNAWLMVTAYSQTTFQAVIAGVPTISVSATANPYAADLAEDGLVVAATDPASAVVAARSLISEDNRRRHVETARAAVTRRTGTLDGHATERTANLLYSVAQSGGPST
jgi:hypothetical protein